MSLFEEKISFTEKKKSLFEEKMSFTEKKKSLFEEKMSFTEKKMSLFEEKMSFTEKKKSLFEEKKSLLVIEQLQARTYIVNQYSKTFSFERLCTQLIFFSVAIWATGSPISNRQNN